MFDYKVRRSNFYVLLVIITSLLLKYLLAPLLAKLHFSLEFYLVFPEILLFLITAIIYFVITKESVIQTLRFKKISIVTVLIVIGIAILSQPIAQLLSFISQLVFPNTIANLFQRLAEIPFIYKLIIIAGVPAICEEVFARGIALKGYDDVDIKRASLMNGLIFGIMHLNGQQFLYAFALGTLFAYMVRITGSIFTSMIAHFTVNGLQVLQAEIALKVVDFMGEEYQNIQKLGVKGLPSSTILNMLIGLVINAIICSGLIYLLLRVLKKKNRNYNENYEGKEIKVFDKPMKILLGIFSISILADLYFLYFK
ncbi:type II CAAX endopeptidase family protein [Clostridium sediminicola]|uniref:CPBP family intramembrane glutamic endopeptidase n=1 Tax=Clostridium sediminicola TaxID=3114879 RepID=UPI0031F23E1C